MPGWHTSSHAQLSQAFGLEGCCLPSRAACFGVLRYLNAWLARSCTAGHGLAFGRPMRCVCDARAQLSQALGLERVIQAAEVAALGRGGILPPEPEPVCASIFRG